MKKVISHVVFVLILLLVLAMVTRAEDVKVSPTEKAELASLAKDVEIIKLQYQILRQNFEAQFAQVPQVQELIGKAGASAKALNDKKAEIAKAHNVDLNKYQINDDGSIKEIKKEGK